MNECPRADMRDMLPDFVNGTLDTTSTAAVTSHISVCPECAAEVELLQKMREALDAITPRVNPARIAEAVVRRTRVAPAPRSRRWVGAAVLALAASAAIAALMIRDFRIGAGSGTPGTIASSGAGVHNDSAIAGSSGDTVTDAMSGDSANSPRHEPTIPAPPSSNPDAAVMKLSSALPVGGALRDLNEADLERLLSQIDEMEALTPLSPGPVIVTSVEVPQ